MSVEHLSEIQIQQYLDRGPESLSESKLEHLQSCEMCRGILADYKRLYSQLKVDDEISLSKDFAARTMQKIRGLENPSAAVSPSVILYSLLGLVSCVLAIWYFVDVKALLKGLGNISIGNPLPDASAFSGITNWLLGFGDSLYLMIFAVMILAGVGLIDRLLAKHKLDKAYFFSV